MKATQAERNVREVLHLPVGRARNGVLNQAFLRLIMNHVKVRHDAQHRSSVSLEEGTNVTISDTIEQLHEQLIVLTPIVHGV